MLSALKIFLPHHGIFQVAVLCKKLLWLLEYHLTVALHVFFFIIFKWFIFYRNSKNHNLWLLMFFCWTNNNSHEKSIKNCLSIVILVSHLKSIILIIQDLFT